MTRCAPCLAIVVSLLVAACGDPGPPLIAFDGTTCTVSGASGVAPGLSEVQVLNTGTNPGEAFLLELTDDYTLEQLQADADAGRYDRFRLEGNDDPVGFGEAQAARFPASMDEALTQPFTASSGSWGVVCSDFVEQRSFAAEDVIEVD